MWWLLAVGFAVMMAASMWVLLRQSEPVWRVLRASEGGSPIEVVLEEPVREGVWARRQWAREDGAPERVRVWTPGYLPAGTRLAVVPTGDEVEWVVASPEGRRILARKARLQRGLAMVIGACGIMMLAVLSTALLEGGLG